MKLAIVYAFDCNELLMHTCSHHSHYTLQAVPAVISKFQIKVMPTNLIFVVHFAYLTMLMIHACYICLIIIMQDNCSIIGMLMILC